MNSLVASYGSFLAIIMLVSIISIMLNRRRRSLPGAKGVGLGILSMVKRAPARIEDILSEVLHGMQKDETERDRRNFIDALKDTAEALNSALDLQTQLGFLMKTAMNAVRGDRAEFFRFDPDRNELVGEYCVGDPMPRAGSLAGVTFRISDPVGLAGWVGESRLLLNLGEVSADPRHIPLDPATRSGLWVPVEHENQLFGVLSIKSRRAQAFAAHDERLMMLFSHQAAIAMRNARLLAESQRRISELSALNRMTTALTSSPDLNQSLDLAVREIRGLLGADACSLLFVDEPANALVLRASAGEELSPSAHRRLPLDQGIAGWVARKEQSALVNDLAADPRSNSEMDRLRGAAAQSMIAVPLKSKGTLVGIVEAVKKRRSGFTEDDLRLLETVSQTVGEVIENARLFGELDQAYSALAEEKRKILESRNILRAVFDGITEDIFIVDRELKIHAINKTAAARLNKDPAEIIEKHCFDLLCGDNAPCPECPLTAALRDGQSHSLSNSGPSRDGNHRQLEVRTYPLVTEGLVNNVIYIAQDVTEKRKMEAALIQSAKLSAMGELGAGIAHEISNPLTAIIANSQMLLRNLDPLHPGYHSAKLIGRAAARADRVTRNFLNMARQEEYAFAPTCVNETIEGALSLLASALKRSRIEINKNLADAPPVYASGPHLETVWMNLMLNARDAIPEGKGGRLEITSRVNQDLGRLEVTFADNGRGIPKAELAQIFEPFFTTKPRGKGTGLGLYSSRVIVSQHRGTIGVQSEVGVGSSVTVALPLNGNSLS